MKSKSIYEQLQTFLEQNAAAGMAAYETPAGSGGFKKMQYRGIMSKQKPKKEKKDY